MYPVYLLLRARYPDESRGRYETDRIRIDIKKELAMVTEAGTE